MDNEQQDPPVAPYRAISARYSPDESEQPHRIVVALAGFTTTLAFSSLQELQEFVHGAQANLGAALGDAIAHIPPPKVIEALDEAFIEDALCRLEDVSSNLDTLNVSVDMDSIASLVHSYVEGLDADDIEMNVSKDPVETEISSLRHLLETKEAELIEQRHALEAEEKILQEQRDMAVMAERAAHEEGDHTLQ
jgi:hypothetical protein